MALNYRGPRPDPGVVLICLLLECPPVLKLDFLIDSLKKICEVRHIQINWGEDRVHRVEYDDLQTIHP